MDETKSLTVTLETVTPLFLKNSRILAPGG